MSQDTVKVLPRVARSTMTLEEILDAMVLARPSLEGFKGGWASTSNHQSNLRNAGVAPPVSDPIITAATDALPAMLRARFYYWDPAPSGQKDLDAHDPLKTRMLNAIDVMITRVNEIHLGMLFSTRTTSYLNRTDGVIASLNKILQTQDATTKIDRHRSHLELHDDGIFLWLTVQQRDKPQIAEDLLLDSISGISSRDQARRTADLREGVDFERPNFLTAVAETDTLGPIEICFIQHVGDHNHSFEAKVHVDGGFEIRKSDLHFPDMLNRSDVMFETSILLAYSLIPRFNKLYVEDTEGWKKKRVEVIKSAMTTLEERYKSFQSILQQQLDEAAE